MMLVPLLLCLMGVLRNRKRTIMVILSLQRLPLFVKTKCCDWLIVKFALTFFLYLGLDIFARKLILMNSR